MNEDEKILAKLFEGHDDPLDEMMPPKDEPWEAYMQDDPEPDYMTWRAALGGLTAMVLMMGTIALIIKGLIWLLS